MSGDNPRSRPGRRRTRSVGSVPVTWRCPVAPRNCNASDEKCSSSTSKDVDFSNFCLSDSDDNVYVSKVEYEGDTGDKDDASCDFSSMYAETGCTSADKIESDSFNENSPHRKSVRRKRKFKRIAVDVEMPASHSRFSCVVHQQKKKRIVGISSDHRGRGNVEGGRFWLNSGKRKRSLREKLQLITDNSGAGSSGCAGHYVSEGGGSSNLSKESKVLGISRLSLNDYPENCSSAATAMDVSYSFSGVSSSSISSSGSETGIFTNDDGREGDDEQSDWVSGKIGFTDADFDFDVQEQGREHDCDKRRHINPYVAYETFFKRTNSSYTEEGGSSSHGLPSSSKIEKEERNNLARVSRKKCRPPKCAFDFDYGPPERVADSQQQRRRHHQFCRLLDSSFKRKNEVDVENRTVASRRHTFSSCKRRKRFAQPPLCPTVDVACENKPQSSFFPFVPPQSLTDISSSDSGDSMQ